VSTAIAGSPAPRAKAPEILRGTAAAMATTMRPFPSLAAVLLAFVSLSSIASGCRLHIRDDHDDERETGDVMRDGGEGDDACAPGRPCEVDCVGGTCDVDCSEATSCDVDCVAGDCGVTCGVGDVCEVDCVGGGCDVDCGQADLCIVDCVGGGCDVACRGSECDVDCVAGDCDLRR
jgi:hypothetical protein